MKGVERRCLGAGENAPYFLHLGQAEDILIANT
jgi:hypothetical protein